MNPRNKQDTRVALITGAGRRIGAAIATHLHQAGFKVIIHCHHSQEEALTLANNLNAFKPQSALVLYADLRIKDACIQLINDSVAWANRLDLLVNNASVFIRSPSDALDELSWDALFNTNVKAPLYLSYAARPSLAEQEGAIINITDIHAQHPLKDYSLYCQSKAALSMQTQSLALEFAPQVRVNAIAPGAMAWPEGDNALSQEQQQKIIAKTPLKRHGEPVYIAQAVLALSDNPFITGQTLNVDGGRSLV